MTRPAAIDLAIIGGGVAGLWLLNRAVKAGYDALLLEKDRLGGGQSIHAQGIVHSGTKYALSGALTRATTAIAAMPQRWRACLAGGGEIDLGAVRVASDTTLLWSLDSLGARMTSFLASKALRSTVAAVPPGRRPAPFDAAGFGGALYRVEEPVLDMTSLLAALARPLPARIRRAEVAALETGGAGGGMRLSLPGGVVVDAARVVVAAGEGAPQAAAALGVRAPAMQRRPLHMVAVEHAGAPPLFGHCIGTGAKPAVTVTTHPAPAGRQVWYLGGDLAETGVTRSPQQQIAAARDLLARTLPFVTLANPRWASLRIDRAEPATEAGARPDTAFAAAEGPLVVAWPTKMTLAPDLADQVLSLLPPPRGGDAAIMAAAALPAPAVARPFWEEG